MQQKKSWNQEDGLKKEWILTNGIGGFCSSTIIGANTRKYHGLLIAPLTPPARRFLILSKLDESIEIKEKNMIYIQMYVNHIFHMDINIKKNLKKITSQFLNIKYQELKSQK